MRLDHHGRGKMRLDRQPKATMQLDRYVVETLMADLVGHDRQPSAFLVYLFLWAATVGGTEPAEVSHRRLAEGTGLSRRTVQDALARLSRRELVSVERESITAVARYTLHRPWTRWKGLHDDEA